MVDRVYVYIIPHWVISITFAIELSVCFPNQETQGMWVMYEFLYELNELKHFL